MNSRVPAPSMRRLLFAVTAGFLLLGPARAQERVNSPDAAVGLPARGASIVVKVEDFAAAREQVLRSAAGTGAELVNAHTAVTDKGRRHGWLQFRLPSDRLPALLGSVAGIGRLYAEKVTTTDHVPEYEELARRAQRLQEHEQRLDGILDDRRRRLRGSDVLYVQERLFRASVDESLILQRRVNLERDARYCDTVVTLFEPLPVNRTAAAERDLRTWSSRAFGSAGGAFNRILSRGVTALAYIAVFAPLWGIVLVAALIGVYWLRKRLRVWLTVAPSTARRIEDIEVTHRPSDGA
jgi:hypothetical protein